MTWHSSIAAIQKRKQEISRIQILKEPNQTQKNERELH